MRVVKKVLAVVLGAAGAVALLYLLAGGWNASRLEAQADAAWREVPGATGDFAAAFPELAANEAALELERRTAVLGLDTSSKLYDRPENASPTDEAAARYSAMRIPIRDYVTTELEAERGQAGPSPAEVAAYLDAEAPHLDAIETHLLGSELPVWERDVALSMAAPLPNLLGQVNLQHVLAARALHHAAAGRTTEAHRTVDAARRLGAFLADRPELVSALIGLSIGRLRYGVLRKLPGRDTDRLQEIAADDWRSRILRGIEYETWAFSSYARTAALTSVQGRLESSYVRMCAADHSRIVRAAVSDLAASDGCSSDPERVDRAAAQALPFWNVPGEMALLRLSSPWIRATRSALDAELTAIVLKTRAAAAAAGAWPESATIPCTTCPRRNWVIERRPDGGLSIRLEPPIEQVPAAIHPLLPTTFVAPPPGPPAP